MWCLLRLCVLVLTGSAVAATVSACVDASAVVLAGALVLSRPRDALVASAPLVSSLSPSQRARLRGEHRAPTTMWWLGMGFSVGLFIASVGLWVSSRTDLRISAFALMPDAVASVRSGDDTLGAGAYDFQRLIARAEQSPAGVAASEVTARQAFERADTILASGGQIDWLEARFWLSRGLAGVHDRDTLSWALVKLGSTYVHGTSQPDFKTARHVWRMAGLLGDKAALCFEADALHHGLGGARDVGAARKLREQAGGPAACRNSAILALAP